MKKTRIISFLTAAVMSVGMTVTAGAFSDMPDGEIGQAMQNAVDAGLINGVTDDIIVDFDVLHPHLGNQIKDYVYDGNEKTNLHVRFTDQFYEDLRKYYPNLSDDTLEYMYLGGEFYSTLVYFNGMMLHSSCVVYNNRAYLFSAPSGTGKSTHTQLWLKRFPGSYILNDD